MPRYDAVTVTTRTARKPATTSQPLRPGDLGFESALWRTADELRGNLDSAEYKHVVLGLIFLKYISDAFEEKHADLDRQVSDPSSDLFIKEASQRYMVLEDQDEYRAENVFWVPSDARWQRLQAEAKLPTIGTVIDDAMEAVETAHPCTNLMAGFTGHDLRRTNKSRRQVYEWTQRRRGLP